MDVLHAIFWVLTMLGSVIGGGFLLSSFSAQGAPQQAAAAAMGVAFVVLPYCFARALSEVTSGSRNALEARVAPGLVACRTCQKFIAPDAPTCPHCGAPTPSSLTPADGKALDSACRHCHRPLETGARVCPYCGTIEPTTPQPPLLLGPR